jgi:hypothetical protein
MSSGFTLEPRESYLYVHLEPGFEITPGNMDRLWSAMSECCRDHGLQKALTEGDGVTRRLTPTESFDLVGVLSRLMPGLAVALCFRGYVPDEQSQSFRAAAMGRGVRMEFFQDLNAALQWLGARAAPKR